MGDTGLFYECTQIDGAEYCLAMLNISTITTDGASFSCGNNIPQCNIGICVPEKCDQNDISTILGHVRVSNNHFINKQKV